MVRSIEDIATKIISHPLIIFPILLLWIGTIFLVNPHGDFPLNDDWQYGYPVKQLLEKGKYEMNSEIAPNIFLQVAWGYAWCKLMGAFSFTILRWSTLILVPFILFIFFHTLRKYTSIAKATLFTLLLSFNPIFYVSAFSFMTEIPFLLLFTVSICGYLIYFQNQHSLYRWLGFSLGIASIFIRQHGLLIIIAFELTLLIQPDVKQSTRLLHLLFISLALSTYFGINAILKPYLEVTPNYISVDKASIQIFLTNPLQTLFNIGVRIVKTVFYFGFFFLPLSIWFYNWFRRLFKNPGSILLIIGITNMLILFAAYFILGKIFPYGGNVFFNLGIGPELLYDRFPLSLPSVNQISPIVMAGFGYLCQLNGSILVVCSLSLIISSIRAFYKSQGNLSFSFQHKTFLFLFSFIMVYLAASIVFSYFDRYLLPLLVVVLILLSTQRLPVITFFQKTSMLILLFVFGYFSICGTHDYLSWNRLSKAIVMDLVDDGIDRIDIDGGHALNGWSGDRFRPFKYRVAFRPLEGFKVVEKRSYYSWLYWRQRNLFILRQ